MDAGDDGGGGLDGSPSDDGMSPGDGDADGGSDPAQPSVWGFATVLELNDAMLNAPWEWQGGLRAYFAVAPHCHRILPDDEATDCAVLQATAGECAVYLTEWKDPWRCTPACSVEQQDCVDLPEGPSCVGYPAPVDVGAIHVEGLKAPVALTADEYLRYGTSSEPDDLFDAGDPVTVEVAGGALPAFSLSATGVAPLAIPSSVVPLRRGETATVRWTPADPASRVQVLLEKGPHHPSLPVVSILCDAPDAQGQVDIAPELVGVLLDAKFSITRFSSILRYTRSVAQPFGQDVGLLVGSMRNLQLVPE